ncbi:DUF488 domain-containing protein [Oceanimonas smirnovii]|uniref:DUF488 domain-containing protein n=1 Tax=Oceanimonas smirnovii TaxID=264574 RepID=A0ABW7NZY5_9GAMM
MAVHLKRIYEAAEPEDGCRILVDRLWPRGLSKKNAVLNDWLKEVAPSDELRQEFHRGDISWDEFRRAYLGELKALRESLRPLADRARSATITLLFAASDERHNNAVVLKQYLAMLGSD